MTETRESYLDRFVSARVAIEFEHAVLSVGSEFLPPEARHVRDGGEPSPAYWEWLCSQIDR